MVMEVLCKRYSAGRGMNDRGHVVRDVENAGHDEGTQPEERGQGSARYPPESTEHGTAAHLHKLESPSSRRSIRPPFDKLRGKVNIAC